MANFTMRRAILIFVQRPLVWAGGLTGRNIVFLLSLVFVSGFHFIMELVDNLRPLDMDRNGFYSDLALLSVFLVVTSAALIRFTVGLFRSPRQPFVLVCCVLIVAAAGASFYFMREQILASDKFFFLLEETNFRSKVQSLNGRDSAIILHARSSITFHKFFIYAGSRSLADGAVSLEAADSLAGILVEVRGCRVEAKHLKDSFYVLSVYCE
jgi:hypothetical protein